MQAQTRFRAPLLSLISNTNKTTIFFALLLFHLSVSTAMYLTATSSFLSGYHDGQGLWHFAMDSHMYHREALALLDTLTNKSLLSWWSAPSFRHTKLMSAMYYIFSPSPISFAPVNALAWSLCVIVVYKISTLLFNDGRKLACMTALVFALWPSHLLLSTQLIRDIFFSLAILIVLLGWIAMLLEHKRAIYVLSGSFGAIATSLIRPESFWLLTFLILLACAIIALRDRKTLPYAFASLLIIFAVHFAPTITAHANPQGDKIIGEQDKNIVDAKNDVRQKLGPAYNNDLDENIDKWFTFNRSVNFRINKQWLMALAQEHGAGLNDFLVNWITPWQYSPLVPDTVEQMIITANTFRRGFLVKYLKQGSSLIDSCVQFHSVKDVVAYTPRALAISLFAPFPNQWFTAGKTGGSSIRILGGIEMCFLYTLMAGFLVFLAKSDIHPWLKIWLIMFMLVTILPIALFAPNVGTLFRMRFIYIAPILICGVNGIELFLTQYVRNRKLT